MTKKQLLKVLIFCISLLILIVFCGSILQLKWLSGSSPSTVQVTSFYEEPKNSIDVLLMGSCNLYNAYNPLIMWEKYGVTSYVRGSSDQELWTSYFYLKEALTYQKPKVVVLEALFLTSGGEYTEFYNRRAVDSMKLSKDKIQLVNTYIAYEQQWNEKNNEKNLEPIYNFMNYIFPIFRYHARWQELQQEDFKYMKLNDSISAFDSGGVEKSSFAKGGVSVFEFEAGEYEADPEYMKPNDEKETIREESLQYLEKIRLLCENNNIELLLVKTPSADYWSFAQQQAVANYADAHDIVYLDCNDTDVYTAEFSLETFPSYGHRLNAYGMQKLSDFLSDYIVENYNIAPRTDDADLVDWWNQGIERYNEDVLNARESDPFWERVRLLNKR